MDFLEYFKSYVPGTDANKNAKVENGLHWANKYRHKNPEAFEEFKTKLQHCQRGSRSACPYTVLELRDIADRMSPGLGNTSAIWSAASSVSDK
jgi:hypothetical protein